RVAIRLAGDGHPPALRLGYEVVARAAALASEAGDGAPHEGGIATYKGLRIESASFQRSATEVVDDDVGVQGERFDHSLVGGRVDVESDAQLVPIYREVIRAIALVVEGRAPPPRFVPRFRPLYLDYIGPQVAEHHRA